MAEIKLKNGARLELHIAIGRDRFPALSSLSIAAPRQSRATACVMFSVILPPWNASRKPSERTKQPPNTAIWAKTGNRK